jgi:tetratricopeptide (TPR) repeat protein
MFLLLVLEVTMKPVNKSFTEILHIITGHIEAREPQKAKELCEEMLRQVKDQAQLWHCYGMAQRELGHVQESLISFHKAVGLNPKLAGVWLNLAISEIVLEKYDEAEKSLEQVLTLLPNHPAAKFQLAVLYHKQKRYTLARELYDELLMAQPNNVNVVLNLANLINEQGDAPTALRLYKRALTLQPDNKHARSVIETLEGRDVLPIN